MKSNLLIKKIKTSGLFSNIPDVDKKHLNIINSKIESYFNDIVKNNTLDKELIEISNVIAGLISMNIDCSKKGTIFLPMFVFEDGRKSFAMEDLNTQTSEILFNILEANICDNLFVKSRTYDAIWVKRSIKDYFISGRKAAESYNKILDISIKSENFHLAGDILQRYHCLILDLGNKFADRDNYIEKLIEFTNIAINKDNLYFFSRLWESILDIGYEKQGFLEKVANDIKYYLFNISNNQNGYFEEHTCDILCKYYRKLKDTISESNILKWQAEQFSNLADITDNSYQKIHLFSQSIECYKRILGNPYKAEIDILYQKIQHAQKNPTLLGMMSNQNIDITALVKSIQEQFSNQNFPSCIMGLWYIKHNFISLENDKRKKSQTTFLMDLFTVNHFNHRGQSVAATQGQAQQNLYRTISRGLFLSAYINPLMNIIRTNFFFTEHNFNDLVIYNRFVPAGYEQMFTKGFDYFFKGMLLEAATILVPLLENSFRYILEDKYPIIFKKNDSEVFHEKIDIKDLIEKVRKEKIYDDIILSHVEELMVNPAINVRNYIAHGMYPYNYFYTEDLKILLYFIFVLTTDSFFKNVLEESNKSS